jgi:hypothetical protein
MRIYTVWGVRKGAADEPELMVAWDEYCVDSNPEGFDEEVEKAIASWGSDLLATRPITLTIPESLVKNAFVADEIPAGVV